MKIGVWRRDTDDQGWIINKAFWCLMVNLQQKQQLIYDTSQWSTWRIYNNNNNSWYIVFNSDLHDESTTTTTTTTADIWYLTVIYMKNPQQQQQQQLIYDT